MTTRWKLQGGGTGGGAAKASKSFFKMSSRADLVENLMGVAYIITCAAWSGVAAAAVYKLASESLELDVRQLEHEVRQLKSNVEDLRFMMRMGMGIRDGPPQPVANFIPRYTDTTAADPATPTA